MAKIWRHNKHTPRYLIYVRNLIYVRVFLYISNIQGELFSAYNGDGNTIRDRKSVKWAKMCWIRFQISFFYRFRSYYKNIEFFFFSLYFSCFLCILSLTFLHKNVWRICCCCYLFNTSSSFIQVIKVNF